MENKFLAYVNVWNGKGIEVEDSNAYLQCMDNAFGWSDFIGIPHASIRAGAAKDVPSKYDHNYWTQVGSPIMGDLVMWGTVVGPYGHIAVFSNTTPSGFRSFDQNWNGHRYCTYENHTYNGIIAYLRPKVTFNTGDNDMTDLNTERWLAYWIYGINGVYAPQNALNGDIDGQLKASVGRDTNKAIQDMSSDQYGQAYKASLYNKPIDNATILKPGNYKVQ